MSELMSILSGRSGPPQTGPKPDSSRPDGIGHAAFLALVLPPAGEPVPDDAATGLPSASPPIRVMDAAAAPWPARPDALQDDGSGTVLAANAPQPHASPDTGNGSPAAAVLIPQSIDLATYSLIPATTETSLSPVDPAPSYPASPPFPLLGGGVAFAAPTLGQPLPSIAPTPRHSDTQTQLFIPRTPGLPVPPVGAPLPLQSLAKDVEGRTGAIDTAQSPPIPHDTATAHPETLAAAPLVAPHPVAAPTLPQPDDAQRAPQVSAISPFPPPRETAPDIGTHRKDPDLSPAVASRPIPAPIRIGPAPALAPTRDPGLPNPEHLHAQSRPATPQGASLAPAPLGLAQAMPAQALPSPAIPQGATPPAPLSPAPAPPPITTPNMTPIPDAANPGTPAPSPTPNTATPVQPPGLLAPPAITGPIPASDPIPGARTTNASETGPLPPAPPPPNRAAMRPPLPSVPSLGGPKPAPSPGDLARPAPADIPLGVEATPHRVSDPQLGGPPPTAPSAPQASGVAAQILRTLHDDAPRNPGAPIDIALDPPELGRLRLALTEVNGTLTLSIAAERPETADLIRRHLALLADEFLRSGLDAPSVQVSHQGAGGGGSGRAHLPHPDATVAAPGPAPRPAPAPNRATADGLDLRL